MKISIDGKAATVFVQQEVLQVLKADVWCRIDYSSDIVASYSGIVEGAKSSPLAQTRHVRVFIDGKRIPMFVQEDIIQALQERSVQCILESDGRDSMAAYVGFVDERNHAKVSQSYAIATVKSALESQSPSSLGALFLDP